MKQIVQKLVTLAKSASFRAWTTVAMFAAGQGGAFAATSGETMPWESPLKTVAASLSGPVAMSVTGIGATGAGLMLVLGREEMSDMAKTGAKVAMGGSFAAFSAGIVSTLFGGSAVFF